MASPSTDDRPTLAALGILAFALADVSHEALGHGLVTLAIGGKPLLLCTCYFDASGHFNLWVPAAGGLTNIAVALASLAALRLSPQVSPHLRFFLILVAAFNLFFAFGYPAYSGIAHVGDWAVVTANLRPQALWRILLVLVSIVGYYASMLLLAGPIAPFAHTPGAPPQNPPDKARFLRLTLIPYLAAILLACAAGALNPHGWRTMLAYGLPAAAAAFGLTQLDNPLGPARSKTTHQAIEPLTRSLPWILAATLTAIFFVGILGPGIRFR